MVEVTKEELERLDKEITLQNMVDEFVHKLGQEKPTKLVSNTDPYTGEPAAVKLYDLENSTVRVISSNWKEPEINIIFKPKKKEIK